MENPVPEKKVKSAKPSQSVTLNIKRETKKKIMAELVRINKKDFGRTV